MHSKILNWACHSLLIEELRPFSAKLSLAP